MKSGEGSLQPEDVEQAVEARRAARLVWSSDPSAKDLSDPRRRSFADAVIKELGEELRKTPPLIQQVMAGAASAAEDLNVDPYQGLTEVLQNADDLGATEVRFALRSEGEVQQLLIVHDGDPVTFTHVLPMTLPFLTTKGEDATQKGRFGIGLKTLARISARISVHSEPYHFEAEKLVLSTCPSEPEIPNFYNLTQDTLLVLDLKPSFKIEGLQEWFEAWDDDGLLFLSSVRSFRWCELNGNTIGERSVLATAGTAFSFVKDSEDIIDIQQRSTRTESTNWRIFTARLNIPAHLERAHKAKGESTSISFAVPDSPVRTGFFIAFKTRVQSTLPFSADAQFDPSTAREELIDNAWNRWLIESLANVVRCVAISLLAKRPSEAWRIIPLSSEKIGTSNERWPGKEFSEAFKRTRKDIAKAQVLMNGVLVPIAETSYEDDNLSDLLSEVDVEALWVGTKAITFDVRDEAGRWRLVLNELGVSRTVGFDELLRGMAEGLFAHRPVVWWVEAGAKITAIHPDEKIFGAPFLLSTDGQPLACARQGTTSRPLVFGDAISSFARRWRLLDKIHDGYGHSEAGGKVRDWLVKRAAFTIDPSPAMELAAFAEFHSTPVVISEDELREIRDRFDFLSDRAATEIGLEVGRAVLLNGHNYKGQTKRPCKVSPVDAYLPKTLDSEHPDWPEAASGLPGMTWISASYDDSLKSETGRRSRKRADGGISRGARRFLMLLGAECAPRLVTENQRQYPQRSIQRQEVQGRGAEKVEYEIRSPDLEKAIAALERLPKRDRKARGSALMRVLARHWRRMYTDKKEVPSCHEARRYYYSKGAVSADWLSLLKESAWVVVGNGELSEPSKAVIRSPQTETLYESKAFVFGVDAAEINSDFAASIGLITAVRASDLVEHLKAVKAGQKTGDIAHIMQVYRTLSKLSPKLSEPYGAMGDVSPSEARAKFSEGTGLICLREGEWRKPADLFSGRDIFHEADMFVPGGAAYADLWRILQIHPPELADCTRYCRKLAQQAYSIASEATLMDIYRHMEQLLSESNRRNKDRLSGLPLACAGQWIESRPIFFVEDAEVRGQLAQTLPGVSFWTPPCEVRDLPDFMTALDVQTLVPRIDVVAESELARDEGDNKRARFQAAVEALSSELARNDPATREKISITWDTLGDVPLFVYPSAFEALASHQALNEGKTVKVFLRAFFADSPRKLHVTEDAIAMPKTGGRAVASLFPWEFRPRVEAQWAASWLESQQEIVESMRFAADEEQKEKLLAATQDLASTLDVAGGQIMVSAPASSTSSARPRRLKAFQGGVTSATVHVGNPVATNSLINTVPLATQAPAPSGYSGGTRDSAPVEFTAAELEQRGWEILTHALNRGDIAELVDFRKRQGVGADGAIDWKQFVELKASARSLPASIEMTNAEYLRAKERGRDYILALVYGLEEGEKTEARLIIDPVGNVSIRPVAGIRLVGLAQATAVILSFGDAQISVSQSADNPIDAQGILDEAS